MSVTKVSASCKKIVCVRVCVCVCVYLVFDDGEERKGWIRCVIREGGGILSV